MMYQLIKTFFKMMRELISQFEKQADQLNDYQNKSGLK